MKIIKLESGDLILADWDITGRVAGWIDILIREAKTLPKCGVLTPLIFDENDKILFSAGFISPNECLPLFNGMGQSYYGQYPGTRECEVASLKLAFISKKLAEKMPPLQSAGTDIFEDSNYCLQAIAHGFKIYNTDLLTFKLDRPNQDIQTRSNTFASITASQRSFRDRWQGHVSTAYRLPVVLSATVDAPSGFAKHARGIIRGLTENGARVLYDNLTGVPEAEDYTSDELVNDIMGTQPRMDCPQITWGLAPLCFKNSGRYKICFSEFECDPIPIEWIPYLNMMDEIWVPTRWMRTIYEQAGVRPPIYVMPLGTDPNYFHPGIIPAQMPYPEKIRFLCNATWEPRKNLRNLILAFQMEFSASDNVCLVIKTANMGLVEDVKAEVESIPRQKGRARVYIQESIVPDEELGSFYTAGDAFVLPTRGEGWGMTLYEALACGIPVITTDYSAPAEVLRDENGKPMPGVHFIEHRTASAQTKYVYMQNTRWAEPIIPELMKKMRKVYNNIDKEKEAAQRTGQFIRENYHWQKVCKIMNKRLEEIYKKGGKN
jgi:glycosyltransferase involved in cell wall biosynthesis